MTTSLNLGTKRVSWISLVQLLHRIGLIARVALVSVELNVHTIRQIVLVHRHTLEVVRAVNSNTDLGVTRLTQIQAFSART